MARISIARDTTIKNVEKITLCVDPATKFRLLRLALRENKSMSKVFRDLVKKAGEGEV